MNFFYLTDDHDRHFSMAIVHFWFHQTHCRNKQTNTKECQNTFLVFVKKEKKFNGINRVSDLLTFWFVCLFAGLLNTNLKSSNNSFLLAWNGTLRTRILVPVFVTSSWTCLLLFVIFHSRLEGIHFFQNQSTQSWNGKSTVYSSLLVSLVLRILWSVGVHPQSFPTFYKCAW